MRYLTIVTAAFLGAQLSFAEKRTVTFNPDFTSTNYEPDLTVKPSPTTITNSEPDLTVKPTPTTITNSEPDLTVKPSPTTITNSEPDLTVKPTPTTITNSEPDLTVKPSPTTITNSEPDLTVKPTPTTISDFFPTTTISDVFPTTTKGPYTNGTIIVTSITTLTKCPASKTCTGQTSTWTSTAGPSSCPVLQTCTCVLPSETIIGGSTFTTSTKPGPTGNGTLTIPITGGAGKLEVGGLLGIAVAVLGML